MLDPAEDVIPRNPHSLDSIHVLWKIAPPYLVCIGSSINLESLNLQIIKVRGVIGQHKGELLVNADLLIIVAHL
jgi:hypothetical protein